MKRKFVVCLALITLFTVFMASSAFAMTITKTVKDTRTDKYFPAGEGGDDWDLIDRDYTYKTITYNDSIYTYKVSSYKVDEWAEGIVIYKKYKYVYTFVPIL